MVARTKIYEHFSLMDADQAAELIAEPIVRKPERLATALGDIASMVELLAPRLNRAVMRESYRVFPESEASGREPMADGDASPAMIAFASLRRRVQW